MQRSTGTMVVAAAFVLAACGSTTLGGVRGSAGWFDDTFKRARLYRGTERIVDGRVCAARTTEADAKATL